MGVTPYGYYPCAVAGAIDRIFGFNRRKTLPEPDDDMREELRQFCAVCGHFKARTSEPLTGPVTSPTWQKAYARSHQRPAKHPRLAGAPPAQIQVPESGASVTSVAPTPQET